MSLKPRIILESQVTPQSGALRRENLYKVAGPSSVPTISLFAISTRHKHVYCMRDTPPHQVLDPIPYHFFFCHVGPCPSRLGSLKVRQFPALLCSPCPFPLPHLPSRRKHIHGMASSQTCSCFPFGIKFGDSHHRSLDAGHIAPDEAGLSPRMSLSYVCTLGLISSS